MVKTLIQGFVVLALALGIAFGAMYFMQEKKPATAPEGQTADKDAPKKEEDKKIEKVVLPQPPASTTERRNPDLIEEIRVPVAVDPRFVQASDEAEFLARVMAERNASLDRRESLLSERQDAFNLIYEDFRSAQEEVSKLRKTVDVELEAASKDLAEQAKLLDTPKTNKSKAAAGAETTEDVASLKKVALVYDNMQADAAAKIFMQMCEDNLTDTVVKLLATMKDRQAAKTLAEIAATQPELASQLTDKLRKLKQGGPANPEGDAAQPPGQ